MTLKDIFDLLSSGELSQISIGGADAGTIDEVNYKRVIGHINLGLSALYKRFRLKEGSLTVQLMPGVTQYELHSKNAESNLTAPGIKFILDAASPFKDDIFKVEGVNTDLDYEIPLNDGGVRYSIKTPKTNTLSVPSQIVEQDACLPEVLKTGSLTVAYRAAHPKIDGGWIGSQPESIELELPTAYTEALLYFVASRINNPIGMTNEFHAGNSYAAKFEQECARLEMVNLQIDQGQTNSRLRAGGWA